MLTLPILSATELHTALKHELLAAMGAVVRCNLFAERGMDDSFRLTQTYARDRDQICHAC